MLTIFDTITEIRISGFHYINSREFQISVGKNQEPRKKKQFRFRGIIFGRNLPYAANRYPDYTSDQYDPHLVNLKELCLLSALMIACIALKNGVALTSKATGVILGLKA